MSDEDRMIYLADFSFSDALIESFQSFICFGGDDKTARVFI